jgi:hypothetical protein
VRGWRERLRVVLKYWLSQEFLYRGDIKESESKRRRGERLLTGCSINNINSKRYIFQIFFVSFREEVIHEDAVAYNGVLEGRACEDLSNLYLSMIEYRQKVRISAKKKKKKTKKIGN